MSQEHKLGRKVIFIMSGAALGVPAAIKLTVSALLGA